MSLATLEERVAALEKQMAELRAQLPSAAGAKDWHQAVGLFPHNELMKQIDAAGQAIREADRQRVRRQKVNAQRTKK